MWFGVEETELRTADVIILGQSVWDCLAQDEEDEDWWTSPFGVWNCQSQIVS